MELVKLHKLKLYCLVAACCALIALFLPWENINYGFYLSGTVNGFRKWGLLSFLGILGVVITSLRGDKTKDYDDNLRTITMISFGVIILGAIIHLFYISGIQGASPAFGLWITIFDAAMGLLLLIRLIKVPQTPQKK